MPKGAKGRDPKIVLAIGHARGGRVTKGNMAVPWIEGLREPLKLNPQVLDQLVDDFINDVRDDPRISETGSKEYLVHYTNIDLSRHICQN